ncbi:MAG: MoxR family ATPase [Thermomicrobiaceae bacterium]
MVIAGVAELAERILDNVDQVIVGKRNTAELMLVALLCERHILVEDIPGVGKTMLARAISRSIGGEFRRIQFTPDLLPSDVSGISYYNQKSGDFTFRPGPVFSNVLLADEINRATPRTQSALLEAMEERTVTIEGDTMRLPRPFLVLATENPIEMEGTFPLPEAQLDRFLVRISIGYPDDEDDELAILERFRQEHPLDTLTAVATSQDLLAAISECREVHVEPELRRYLTRIVRATRTNDAVKLGVSPRGTLGLFQASQALAAIRGRDFVLPDDIRELAGPVMEHRVALNPETRLRGRSTAEVLQGIIDEVEVPVEQI